MVLIRVYEFILIMDSGKSGWGDRNIPYTESRVINAEGS